jgi:hypothetical protein
VRPAKGLAVQTGTIARQAEKIAQLEDTVKRLQEQNELLLRVLGKLA